MKFSWNLPQNWCHAGIPQGNGLFGSLLWGNSDSLKITVNRSDYWFHGDNLPPDAEQSYQNLKEFLQNSNETELLRVFAGEKKGIEPLQSTRLPVGRLLVNLPEGCNSGELNLDTTTSLAKVKLDKLQINSIVPRELPVVVLSVSGENYQDCSFKSCPPVAEEIKTFFNANNFPAPEIFDNADGMSGGWVQEGHNAKSLCVMWKKVNKSDSVELFMVTMLGDTVVEAQRSATKLLDKMVAKTYTGISAETVIWWDKYWEETPVIDIPDKEISELYYLGMYRMAGLYAPNVPPATLQGAWLEDDRMAPWSNDYHFNINVQECYWPTFAGNHPEYILPLFDMVKSWKEVLHKYAKNFVGIEDGQMLPHALDDRGIAMGGFWPGHIDHSCTAWMAQLMWQYWRYTLDDEFMRDTLYPFMKETMNVYAEMLEDDDKGNLFLAVESSPEYFENSIRAWGKNSTIHLASIHFLIDSLLELSEKLNIDSDKRLEWQDISKRLPIAALTEDKEICIWEGQPLAEGHRHFSHLIGLYPYDLLDWRTDTDDAKMVKKTIAKWQTQGEGLWSAWSYPWASILLSRLGNADGAHEMLSLFRREFMSDDYALRYMPKRTNCSIMQIEAGMASAAAVMEMCVYTSRGVIYPMAGIPCYWKDISFKNIRTEGALLVSGERKSGILQTLTVKALKGGKVKISLPEGEYDITSEKINGGRVYETTLAVNEKLRLELIKGKLIGILIFITFFRLLC